jgi:hypothetical protein
MYYLTNSQLTQSGYTVFVFKNEAKMCKERKTAHKL